MGCGNAIDLESAGITNFKDIQIFETKIDEQTVC